MQGASEENSGHKMNNNRDEGENTDEEDDISKKHNQKNKKSGKNENDDKFRGDDKLEVTGDGVEKSNEAYDDRNERRNNEFNTEGVSGKHIPSNCALVNIPSMLTLRVCGCNNPGCPPCNCQ